MKRQFKKLIIVAISVTVLLFAGGAIRMAVNALPIDSKVPYDAKRETTITSDGKKVNSDGELILLNCSLTADEKSIILTIIAEEIRWKRPSYITHNNIDKSEFTLEHVRNAFYEFGSKDGIAEYHDWVIDRKKANSIMTSFYGVDPNLENGKSYNWFEMNSDGVTNVDSGFKMISVEDNKVEFWDFASGDTWSEADMADYTYEDGYLIMNGLYTEDSNGGIVISDVPFIAKFKVNEDNPFRFALESIEY